MTIDSPTELRGSPQDHPGGSLPLSWWKFPRLLALDIRKSIPVKGKARRIIRQGWRIPFSAVRLQNPLFIIGAPRSGTTFLGNCLGEVGSFSYQFEPRTTKRALQHVYYRQWTSLRSRATYRITYAALLAASANPKGRFCEKTPQNSLIVPFLARTFHDAQFIHIIRDGLDSATSLLEKPWFRQSAAGSGKREPGGFPHGPYPRPGIEPERQDEFRSSSDFHRCIWVWRVMTSHALTAGRILPSHRYMEIHYEDIVKNPAETSTKLSGFLGLGPADQQGLKYALEKAHTGSIGRWKASLSQDDLAVAESEAGPLLSELGYGVNPSH